MMASLETDPSGRLRLKFRVPSQEHPIREPLRLDDTRENRRLGRRIIKEVERELAARDYNALCKRFPDSVRLKRIFSGGSVLLTEFARTWLGELVGGARASTLVNYETINRLWILQGPIAQRPLSELTAEDGASYVAWLRTQGTTNHTRNKAIEQLGRIFKRARQLGKMRPEQDPLIGVQKFASDESEKDELGAWTVQEREHLITAAYGIADWQGCAVEVAFFTGLRRGELFGLKWADLDFDSRTIKVRRSVGQYAANSPKTDGSAATVEMLPRVRNALLSQRQRVGLASLWVFPSSTGEPQQVGNFVTRLWPKIVDATEVPYRPFKQTRHTFAVLALEAGGEGRLLWVQRMLRHTTTQMLVQHYLKHAKPGDPGREFLDRFERQA